MIVKIAPDVAVNTDDINYIIAYSSNTSKEILKKATDNNQLLNLTKHKATRSLICFNNGKVIAMNTKIDTLVRKINSKGNPSEDIVDE